MGSLNTASELVEAGSCSEGRLLPLLGLTVWLFEVTLTLPEGSKKVDMELGASLGYVRYTAHPVLVGDTLDTEVCVAAWKGDVDSVTFWEIEGTDDNTVDLDETS